MGLFDRFRFGKGQNDETGVPVLTVKLSRPEGLPESLQAKEIVCVVRWVNDTGVEEITTEIFAEEMQPTLLNQYELGLGMLHIAAYKMNGEMAEYRKAEYEDAENEARWQEERAEDDPVLFELEGEDDEVVLLSGEIMNKKGEIVGQYDSVHDHPCGDPGCSECWQVTRRLSDPVGADFDKPGFIPPARTEGKDSD